MHHVARSRRRVGSREEDVVGIFWSFARDELLALGVEEKVVRLSELRRDRLQKFGPLDAALFPLAERRRRAVLVTTDAILLGSFRASGLSALSPDEVFSGAG